MPDMTMCSSQACPMKYECYRKMAIPNKFQSFSNFEYTCNEQNGFKDYIAILDNNKITKREV